MLLCTAHTELKIPGKEDLDEVTEVSVTWLGGKLRFLIARRQEATGN